MRRGAAADGGRRLPLLLLRILLLCLLRRLLAETVLQRIRLHGQRVALHLRLATTSIWAWAMTCEWCSYAVCHTNVMNLHCGSPGTERMSHGGRLHLQAVQLRLQPGHAPLGVRLLRLLPLPKPRLPWQSCRSA